MNEAVSTRQFADADRGFGIIEIVVAMFLLGLLAIATLPLLAQSMTVTSKNTTIAAATQVVEQQVEQLRASGSSCSAVKTLAASTPAAIPERGVSLQPHLQLNLPASDVCQVPYLRTVSIRIWVTVAGSSAVLAEVNKLILLDTA
jgi:prepilin-type N-terminal cleavage/methylation domain-containing protein